mgnify:CR=1 FL=1
MSGEYEGLKHHVARIDALPPTAVKVVENQLRRLADALGLELRKNPARDPRRPDFGLFQIVDPTRGLTAGVGAFPYSLDHRQVFDILAAR